MRLGTVFDDPKIMLLRDRHDLVHVSWLATKMDWDNSDSRFCDLGFDQAWIDIKGVFVGVAKDNTAARLRDCLRCRDPRVRRRDNFVTGF